MDINIWNDGQLGRNFEQDIQIDCKLMNFTNLSDVLENIF